MPSLVSLHRGLCGGFHPKFATFKPKRTPSKTWSSLEAVGGGNDVGVFDAVVVARRPIRTIEGLIPDARESVTQAAKVEKLFVRKQNKETLVGNARGLDLANIAHRLDVELGALKKKMAELNIADKSQEARLEFLTNSSESYRQIRSRFLVSFSNEHFGRTEEKKKTIEQGNKVAHWGDILFDRTLYDKPNGSTDTEAFKALYGVLPKDVEQIKHHGTINLLNTHAGILSSKRKIATPKFFDAFSNFISLFEKSKFDESFHEKKTEVTLAYEEFLGFAENEVKSRKPKKRLSKKANPPAATAQRP
ncbi:hypothetical protein HOY82DRAFT_611734 [Tuber indicum]|nr:hypothetical protein HOY82DRAFT_611734 [Tuber indicum]